MNQPQKRRLGRGLAALIGDDPAPEAISPETPGLKKLSIDLIKANPNNPRRHFADDEIESLANSLRDKGLLQPILVRPAKSSVGLYEIIAGERRWRAAQRAGLHEVPVIVRDLDDRETLEIAIVENVQRSDLNALEEARAYRMLIDQYQYTQQQLAAAIGKSRSHIANTLRLMTLPETVQAHIESGSLSAGHARTLVASENPSDVAQQIIKLGLSVRQAEDLTRQTTAKKKAEPMDAKDADTRSLEKTLTAALGLVVHIQHKGPGGEVTIAYKSLEQLELISHRLGRTD
jgi:ParB family transcriptional regulator, chromosome partitioning protein